MIIQSNSKSKNYRVSYKGKVAAVGQRNDISEKLKEKRSFINSVIDMGETDWTAELIEPLYIYKGKSGTVKEITSALKMSSGYAYNLRKRGYFKHIGHRLSPAGCYVQKKQEYMVYRGEKYLAAGTAEELAEKMGIKLRSFYNYYYRTKGNYEYNDLTLEVYRIEE